MPRHDTLSALARAAAIGVATLMLVGAPTLGHAHGSSRSDRGRGWNWGHGRDNDHGRCDGGSGKCTKSSQCDDGNPCTIDACRTDGTCSHSEMAGCQTCSCDSDCNDGNACTKGDCNHGVCNQKQIPGCSACTTDAGCNDGDPCTADSCQAGSCTSQPIAGCTSCNSCGDCDDHNPCTDDQCGTDGVCHATPIAGCVQCVASTECDDNNPQTTDACTGGLCVHRPIDLPPVEVCDDGLDNDHNGDADCADSACAAFPACAPPVEICGDCIDNDGDGLVDFEDPDCCANPQPLILKKVVFRTADKPRRDRLKIRGIYSRNMPASFDATKQDTTLQISDEFGTIFCSTIDHKHFMPKGQHGQAFWGGQSFANGLSDGKFTVKPNRTVKFKAHGRNANIRTATPMGHNLRFTLRVGAHCSQASMAPRTKGNVILVP